MKSRNIPMLLGFAMALAGCLASLKGQTNPIDQTYGLGAGSSEIAHHSLYLTHTASIPFDQIGAVAGKQYSSDGLSVVSSLDGASLSCLFQRLNGRLTTEGLWLVSTVDGAKGEPFRVIARSMGRAGPGAEILPRAGRVEVKDQVARFIRPRLTEEYSLSIDGIRQDFLIESRPQGNGSVVLELAVDGAKAQEMACGALLVLEDGERKMVYNRVKAEDARGKELTAKLKALSANRLAVILDDTTAEYPVRIDPTFSDANWLTLGGGAGVNGEVDAAIVDGAGNLYIGGGFNVVGNVSAGSVAKWNGSSWSALGLGIGGDVYTLAMLGNNLIVAGQFTTAGGFTAPGIALWDVNAGGWGPLTLGGPSSVSFISALAVSGNNLFAGGSFRSIGGVSANNIAQWDGSNWTALGSGINEYGQVSALVVSGNNLYAGGYFTVAGGVSANNIAQWNGSSWSPLGLGLNSGNSAVSTLAVLGGNLFAGGAFKSAGGVSANNIAQWNGSSWSPLGSGVNSYVKALVVSGGNLFAGGDFTNAGGASANYVAWWNGSSWSALGSGVNGTFSGLNGGVSALAVSGGGLFVGGLFSIAGGVSANNIAQWNGSYWSAMGSINSEVSALAASGNDLYVGGSFTTAGGGGANGIAKWNGNSWSPLGSGLNGPVLSLAVSGMTLYVGGGFSYAGGVPAQCIAQWNGSSWSALGAGLNGGAFALAASGNDLYVGGSFTTAGGGGANGIAKWNGNSWSPLGSGLNGPVLSLAVSGMTLYVGGGFSYAGEVPAQCIAQWNGSSWSALGSGMDTDNSVLVPSVNALAVSGGNLFAGGEFTTAGGVSANNIAQWNGSSWSALGSGMNGTVFNLAAGYDLYVGGGFSYAGGVPAQCIAQWNGSSWSALASGMNGTVETLAVSGKNLYTGGAFTTAGTNVSPYVAEAIDLLPSVGIQPADQTVWAGSSIAFTANVTELGPITYLWQFNGTDLQNLSATTPTLILNDLNTNSGGSYAVIVENPYGALTSGVASLAIDALTTMLQPTYQNLATGSNFAFTVGVTGPGPFIYQWEFNGIPIPKATNASFQLYNATTNQDGSYAVVITNSAGSVTSAPVLLSVYNPPLIVGQTTNIATAYGFTVTNTVTATGYALQYQWLLNGQAISGATNSSLTLTNIGDANSGNYSVVVSNLVGSVTSQLIPLSVYEAVRILPTGYWQGVGYWPNVPMTYTIEAGPPAGTPNYSVQDEVEAQNSATFSYFATNINYDGAWDSVDSIVKFEPFFDGHPRVLTYQIVPAANATNWMYLEGVISINGVSTPVSGPSEINLLPLHPADNGGDNALPIDGIININEMTAYTYAWWKVPGAPWSVDPAPIPQDYVTSAIGIWQAGEYYTYFPSYGTAPACWANVPTPANDASAAVSKLRLTPSAGPNSPTPKPLTPGPQSQSPAVASMPSQYTPGVPFTVTLTLTPSNSVAVYAVEDQIPTGWVATDFMPSDPAVFDSINNMVKWGPYFDNNDRTLNYQITPPTNASGIATFSGTASFDGSGVAITGVRQISNAPPLSVSAGTLVSSKGFQINLVGSLGVNYILQASTNLLNWISVQTNTNSLGTVQFTDPQATNLSRRFYRAIGP